MMDVSSQVDPQTKDIIYDQVSTVKVLRELLSKNTKQLTSTLNSLIVELGYSPKQFALEFNIFTGVYEVKSKQDVIFDNTEVIYQAPQEDS